MCKQCNHSNCAVCSKIEERNVFKSILKTTYPDVYLCEHANYKITNKDGDEFTINSLEKVIIGKYGSFVHDIFTGEKISLNGDNFVVLCTKQEECEVKTPYVLEYVPRHKKAAE